MNRKCIAVVGSLGLILLAGFLSSAFAQTVAEQKDWAPFIAKFAMGLSLSLGLAGSAIGLVIGFQALLGGGEENFYKVIPVALMPSTQGIYAMVVFFTNMDKFDSDPYSVAGKAAIAMVAMLISGWYQGMVCAAGIKSVLEGKNTVANALVAGAMPETYAVFALVMTFIMP
ncbi:MAG: hypothetical protein ACNYWU_04530 [Desulfobacterales bacterium]